MTNHMNIERSGFRELTHQEVEAVTGGSGNVIIVTARRTSTGGLDFTGGLPNYGEEAMMFLMSLMQGTTEVAPPDDGGQAAIEEFELEDLEDGKFKLSKDIVATNGVTVKVTGEFDSSGLKGASIKVEGQEYRITNPFAPSSPITQDGVVKGNIEFRVGPVGGQNPFVKDMQAIEFTGGIRYIF